VRYAIIGAWALSLWGKPRATADLDFLVLVKDDRLERLTAVMTNSGMDIDELWQQWNPLLRGSQARLQYRGVTIDLLLPRDQHDQAIFRRLRKKRVAGRYYWVVSLEDFILQKVAVRRKIVCGLVENYGVPAAEVARQVGISTSGVSKLLTRTLSS